MGPAAPLPGHGRPVGNGLLTLSMLLVRELLLLCCCLRVRSANYGLHALQQSLRQYGPLRYPRSGPGCARHAPSERSTVLIISHAAKPPGVRAQDDAIPGR